MKVKRMRKRDGGEAVRLRKMGACKLRESNSSELALRAEAVESKAGFRGHIFWSGLFRNLLLMLRLRASAKAGECGKLSACVSRLLAAGNNRWFNYRSSSQRVSLKKEEREKLVCLNKQKISPTKRTHVKHMF